MIDVKLTNAKLLERGTLIVADFAGTNYEKSREAVLRSIHKVDSLTDELKGAVMFAP